MDGLSPDLVAEAESARTTDHRSTHTARVEVLTRAEPRRSWTTEQKRQIVAESLGSDLTATEVARKYRISSGQLYTWRQQLVSLPGSVITRAPMQFAAVELATAASPPLPSPMLPEPPTPAASPSEGVEDAIRATGASLLYLPPYSPDLNPIEQVFAKLKALLRGAAARTKEALWTIIGQLIGRFKLDECRNYLTNSGYEFT